MEITFLGTSSGVPTRSRNVSSVALRLIQRGEIWLLDCGEGTQHQLIRSNLRSSQIRRIFITHMHGDHIFGLMGLLASCGMAGTVSEIDLYGPPGLDRYIENCQKWSQMHLHYTLRVHTIAPGLVYEDGDYAVTCGPLHHRVTAYGYRIQETDRPGRFDAEKAKSLGIPFGPVYGQLKQGKTVRLEDGRTFDGEDFCDPPELGRSLAYCTDTIYCDAAVQLAYQADVLIHESTFAHQDQDMAEQRLHSTSTMAAQVAAMAQVKLLFLTHFSPRYAPGNALRVEDLLAEAQAIFPHSQLARDFLTYELPRHRTITQSVQNTIAPAPVRDTVPVRPPQPHRYESLKHLASSEFQDLVGITPATLRALVKLIPPKIGPRSSPPKTTVELENQVLMALDYWRNHLTYRDVANLWNLGEATVAKLIREVKTHIANSSQFRVATPAEMKANPGQPIITLLPE